MVKSLVLICGTILLTQCTFDTSEDEMINQPKAPRVYAVPPAKGEWTGSNHFGSEQPFSPDTTNRQRLLFLPEYGPPARWSITLGIKTTRPAIPFAAQAEILFGAGGASKTVNVDWVNGTCLAVTANSIMITAIWTTPPVGGANSDVEISAMVGRGECGNPDAPTLTQLSTIAPGGDGALQAVPAFARRAWVQPASKNFFNCYTATSYLEFHQDSSGASITNAIPGDALKAQLGSGIVLPFDARFWRFHNADAGITSISTIWAIEP